MLCCRERAAQIDATGSCLSRAIIRARLRPHLSLRGLQVPGDGNRVSVKKGVTVLPRGFRIAVEKRLDEDTDLLSAER